MATITKIEGPRAKTMFQEKKEERNRKIRTEFVKLMKENPDRSRVMVKDYLKEKYGICSDSVYYDIIRDAAI